jgi:hypothetical protein
MSYVLNRSTVLLHRSEKSSEDSLITKGSSRAFLPTADVGGFSGGIR